MSDDTMSSVSLLIALSLHVGLLSIGIWDVYVMYAGRPHDTVSYIVGGWARQWPMLGVIVGILVGHLFWTQRLP